MEWECNENLNRVQSYYKPRIYRGFIPLQNYYVIVTRLSQTSLSQTSVNANHNANSCPCNKYLQVRCDKKSHENKFKHFVGNNDEMIMESILSARKEICLLPLTLCRWLFACDSSRYAEKSRIWTYHLYICTPRVTPYDFYLFLNKM